MPQPAEHDKSRRQLRLFLKAAAHGVLAADGGKTQLFLGLVGAHGHAEHVKYGTDELICRARQEGADIVLYGHTHSGVTAYDDGLYIMNPGSIRDGHYGMIDIVPGGIMLNEAKL